jgi:hypothetical protein
MKRRTKFSGKTALLVSQFLLLLLLPVFAASAAPQSFFVSPGQTIENGAIARAYCLEYSKDVLRANNIAELTRLTGAVKVTDTSGREIDTSFQELYQSGKVAIIPFNSYEHMQFVFLDESIAQIKIGNDGIGLFRDRMTEYENTLTRKNIQKILELEAHGKPHSEVQQSIWRIRETATIEDKENKKLTIDLQTSEKEEEKVYSTFHGSPTVSYRRGGETFLRIDGLLDNTGDINEHTTELITHYHGDHINHTVVEQALKEGNFNRIIGPYPGIDASSRAGVFSTLDEYRKNKEIEPGQANRILDVTPNGNPLNLVFTQIGDFTHSSFRVNEDTVIEMFKYQVPSGSNLNADGMIYQISHKNATWLVFGDFDYIRGIENLLDASAANEKRRIEIREELSELQTQRLIRLQNKAFFDYGKLILEETAQNPVASPTEIEEQQEMITFMNGLTAQLQELITALEGEIKTLNEELRSLPILKADIIKWPHHAHRFPESERADRVIKKLNDVVEPQYIIWQRYNNQSSEKFEDYIERLNLSGKCYSSDDMEITIISLLEWIGGAG